MKYILFIIFIYIFSKKVYISESGKKKIGLYFFHLILFFFFLQEFLHFVLWKTRVIDCFNKSCWSGRVLFFFRFLIFFFFKIKSTFPKIINNSTCKKNQKKTFWVVVRVYVGGGEGDRGKLTFFWKIKCLILLKMSKVYVSQDRI